MARESFGSQIRSRASTGSPRFSQELIICGPARALAEPVGGVYVIRKDVGWLPPIVPGPFRITTDMGPHSSRGGTRVPVRGRPG